MAPDAKQPARLADQAAVLTIGRVAERAVGFLSGMALVRLLTKDEYGSFLQIALLCQLATTFLLFGLPLSLFYFVPRAEPAGRKRVVLTIGGLIVASSAAGGLLLALFSPLVVRAFHNPLLEGLGILIGAYAFAYSLNTTIEPTLVSIQQTRRAGILAAVSGPVMLAATLLPAWQGWGIAAVYSAMLAVIVVRIAYVLGVVARMPGATSRGVEDGVPLGALFAFALPLGFSSIAWQSNRQLDGFLVSFLFNPADYAVYARGAFEIPLVDLVPFTLANVILPRLVELWKSGERQRLLNLWTGTIRVSALLVFPAFAYCMLFAQEIIVTLFTPEYSGSVPIFRVYLLSLPLRLTHFSIVLQAIGDSRTVMRSTVWTLVINLALAPVLCLLVGPVGAAAGFAVSQIFAVVYVLHTTRARTGFSLGELLPWPSLARTAGIIAAVSAVVKVIGLVPAPPLVRLALTGPPFLLMTLFAYHRFGGLTDEDRDHLRRWTGRRAAPAGGGA